MVTESHPAHSPLSFYSLFKHKPVVERPCTPIALMLCPHCRTINSNNALNCALCGLDLSSSPTSAVSSQPQSEPIPKNEREKVLPFGEPTRAESKQAWPLRPLPSLGIGLLLVPLLKQIWIFNYIFNFLATLVHEIGHAVFAWLMGMPALPTVSMFGGGVTPALAQIQLLCVAILVVMGWFAWQVRAEQRRLIASILAMLVYTLLAFTSASQNLVIAGGVLFEIGGACACFYWVLAAPSSLGFDRPLYSLWGWWMLLNRLSETWLMLRDRNYWDDNVIAQSGLGEGLVNDLPRLCDEMNLAPTTVLTIALLLGLSALPIAFGLWCFKKRSG